jgi:hypothetical protein
MSSARRVSPRCESTVWLAIEHAEGESRRRTPHGHISGGRDLGDDGSAAITDETGRQTEVCGPAAKLILPMKFYCMAFFIILGLSVRSMASAI